MPVETFLVRLRNNASSQEVKYLFAIIAQINGRVEMYSGDGKVIIASFDHSYIEKIRRIPCVNLVGGVTFRGGPKEKKTLSKYELGKT
jgi:hypothetical protein